MRAHAGRVAALLLLAGAALACASPAGIRRVDAREVHRTLTANVLTAGEPSVPSRHVLQRMGIADLFERDPAAALGAIQAAQPTSGRIFALAELSFWLGDRTGDRARYLAAAVYAWAYLFPGEGGEPPAPTDPRYRLACDLYNRGLTEGIRPEKLAADDWAGERLQLPFGQLDVAFDRSELAWSGWRLSFSPTLFWWDFSPTTTWTISWVRAASIRFAKGISLISGLMNIFTSVFWFAKATSRGCAPPPGEVLGRNGSTQRRSCAADKGCRIATMPRELDVPSN